MTHTTRRNTSDMLPLVDRRFVMTFLSRCDNIVSVDGGLGLSCHASTPPMRRITLYNGTISENNGLLAVAKIYANEGPQNSEKRKYVAFALQKLHPSKTAEEIYDMVDESPTQYLEEDIAEVRAEMLDPRIFFFAMVHLDINAPPSTSTAETDRIAPLLPIAQGTIAADRGQKVDDERELPSERRTLTGRWTTTTTISRVTFADRVVSTSRHDTPLRVDCAKV
uniref:Uncharacterized protein n=1 Tax=Plectus sambesii TaxID=2011161 RepID=A0A914VZM0_9BILA